MPTLSIAQLENPCGVPRSWWRRPIASAADLARVAGDEPVDGRWREGRQIGTSRVRVARRIIGDSPARCRCAPARNHCLFHSQGSSSTSRLCGMPAIRASTSANQACGSTSLSLAMCDRAAARSSIDRDAQTDLHAQLALKGAALAKLKSYERGKRTRFRPSDRLLAFLEAL